jgi:hypothetical protein
VNEGVVRQMSVATNRQSAHRADFWQTMVRTARIAVNVTPGGHPGNGFGRGLSYLGTSTNLSVTTTGAEIVGIATNPASCVR